ncbi:TIGR03862 family flavoprotein [Roseivivax sp. GX 12232]|uniref:TIGR03862 family flavoprotein n=1 Tax=Roseivivax sp. GX 12232 TaxID=2900547 RepID=UPI001E5179BA|nr:TIGR03862 family flavoprotein [Roseivivax sp. GX 12232]MCE0506015.1 TIGR03862 family flavoprotein [Roseivivax sp. GX 12232]
MTAKMAAPGGGSSALVIGGGPAGLMAAEALLDAGWRVTLAEQKPSLARKFLMAGKSGLNLTKAEPAEEFLKAYGAAADWLAPMLAAFGPEAAVRFAEELGQEVFTGSTGRVFPKVMKASPLLRAWLARLEAKRLEVRTRWRWTGGAGPFIFDTPEGPVTRAPDVAVLAAGGASWRRLGSDGAWAGHLEAEGLELTPFAPANAGLKVDWSPHMTRHFGAPLKNIALTAGDITARGEAVISARGLEGGGLYPLSPALRQGAALTLDLAPDRTVEALARRLARPRGKDSLSNWLRKALKLSPQAQALVMECARPLPREPEALARLLKALPVAHAGLRPLDEAISTAGGLPRAALDEGLMLRAKPGVFAAGEMLDWEAPTGGYLLTACMATGLWAGRHAARHGG